MSNKQNYNLEKEAQIASERTKSFKAILQNKKRQLNTVKKQLKTFVDKVDAPWKEDDRRRNTILGFPPILFFESNGILFFIDFTILIEKNDESNNMLSCFIYGTRYYNEKNKLEDKTLEYFIIDEQGIIKAKHNFENENWLNNKKHINDLHLRTLEKIWVEALHYINKDKLQ